VNHSSRIAIIKSALDLVYTEWQAKPASFVSYGGISGGIRAVEQLRQVLVELHMVPVRDAVVLPMAPSLFGDDGRLVDARELDVSASLMLDRIAWWAQTLREARLARPYAV
jgi:NAD(P)H-dependent FMN reductase